MRAWTLGWLLTTGLAMSAVAGTLQESAAQSPSPPPERPQLSGGVLLFLPGLTIGKEAQCTLSRITNQGLQTVVQWAGSCPVEDSLSNYDQGRKTAWFPRQKRLWVLTFTDRPTALAIDITRSTFKAHDLSKAAQALTGIAGIYVGADHAAHIGGFSSIPQKASVYIDFRNDGDTWTAVSEEQVFHGSHAPYGRIFPSVTHGRQLPTQETGHQAPALAALKSFGLLTSDPEENDVGATGSKIGEDFHFAQNGYLDDAGGIQPEQFGSIYRSRTGWKMTSCALDREFSWRMGNLVVGRKCAIDLGNGRELFHSIVIVPDPLFPPGTEVPTTNGPQSR